MENEQMGLIGEREMCPPRSYPSIEIYAEATGEESRELVCVVCELHSGTQVGTSWPRCDPRTLVDVLNVVPGIRCTGLRVVESGV